MSSAEDGPGWAALPRGLCENGRRGAGRPVPIPGAREGLLCGPGRRMSKKMSRGGRRTTYGGPLSDQAQKRWFPITLISGRDQIQALVAVFGLK